MGELPQTHFVLGPRTLPSRLTRKEDMHIQPNGVRGLSHTLPNATLSSAAET